MKLLNVSKKMLMGFVTTLSIVAISLMICIGTNANAGESNDTSTYSFSDSWLTSNVQAPNNATFNQDFEFSFTPVSINGDTTVTGVMPSVDSQTLNLNVAAGAIQNTSTPTEIYTQVGDDTKTTNAYIVQRQLSSFMPELTKFTRAGEYLYTVKETTTTPSSDWKMSGSVYNLRIYVKNVGESLEIAGATFEQTKDDFSNDIEVIKKNPQQLQGSSNNTTPVKKQGSTVEDTYVYNGFTLMNSYSPLSDLTVSKKVEGEYGDKTKDFNFSMTLANTDVAAGTKYTAVIYDSVKSTAISGVDFEVNTVTTFALKHGYKILFDGNTHQTASGTIISTDKLPVGTQYSYTETGSTDYTPDASTSSNTGAGIVNVKTTGTSGSDLNVAYNSSSNKAATVGNGAGNASDVTNTYKQVTPTGFLIDIAPYLLLIGVPLAVAIAWLVYRRKKAHQG